MPTTTVASAADPSAEEMGVFLDYLAKFTEGASKVFTTAGEYEDLFSNAAALADYGKYLGVTGAILGAVSGLLVGDPTDRVLAAIDRLDGRFDDLDKRLRQIIREVKLSGEIPRSAGSN